MGLDAIRAELNWSLIFQVSSTFHIWNKFKQNVTKLEKRPGLYFLTSCIRDFNIMFFVFVVVQVISSMLMKMEEKKYKNTFNNSRHLTFIFSQLYFITILRKQLISLQYFTSILYCFLMKPAPSAFFYFLNISTNKVWHCWIV